MARKTVYEHMEETEPDVIFDIAEHCIRSSVSPDGNPGCGSCPMAGLKPNGVGCLEYLRSPYRKPDSQERIEADKNRLSCEVFGGAGKVCSKCQFALEHNDVRPDIFYDMPDCADAKCFYLGMRQQALSGEPIWLAD